MWFFLPEPSHKLGLFLFVIGHLSLSISLLAQYEFFFEFGFLHLFNNILSLYLDDPIIY